MSEESQSILPLAIRSNYAFVKEIGRGSKGIAILVRHLENGQPYVVKYVYTKALTGKQQEHALAEVSSLRVCDHVNIVRLREFIHEGLSLVLVLEYAAGGDLAREIRARRAKNMPFREFEVATIFVQLALTLRYIHSQNVLHRDIKPANVFFTKDGLLKLGDFGLSKQYDQDVTKAVGVTMCGTPFYAAPEIWSGSHYSLSAELWALGVVMYETMFLRKPFRGNDMQSVMLAIVKGHMDPIPNKIQYSDGMRETCMALLSYKPEQRPALDKILTQPVFQRALQRVKLKVLHPNADKDPRMGGYIAEIDAILLGPSSDV